MSLLTPDTGLLFWMIISFGIVFAILSKYGFPVIMKAVEERKAHIEQSMEAAKIADEQLANLRKEGEKILEEAYTRQKAILKEALEEKEHILEEARQKAEKETHRKMEEATARIREEKEKAIREIRFEIADLSVTIAEKVLSEKIGHDDKQQQIIDRLLNDVSFSKS